MSRFYGIESRKYLLSDFKRFRIIYRHGVKIEFPDRHRIFRGLVSRIFVDCKLQQGRIRHGQGICLKEIVVFTEGVITFVPHGCTGALAFLLQSGFREITSGNDGHRGGICEKILLEISSFRENYIYGFDGDLTAQGDMIGNPYISSLDLDGTVDIGTVISEIFQMVVYIVYRAVHHVRIVDDRCHTYLLHKFIPAFAFSICPVVDILERTPAPVLLLKIWCEKVRIELLVVGDLYLVSGKAVLVSLQGTRGAAGNDECRCQGSQY